MFQALSESVYQSDFTWILTCELCSVMLGVRPSVSVRLCVYRVQRFLIRSLRQTKGIYEHLLFSTRLSP